MISWEKFAGWIDPGALDIFDKGIEVESDNVLIEEETEEE